ncbi:MAG: hypothetical protein ACYSUY_12250 [Planctomycetota bacterium]|jgi:hypothetical protein
MNTFWLKIVGVVVAVLGVVILINVFSSSKPEPQPRQEEQGFSHQVETDRKKFLTKPAPAEANTQSVQSTQQTDPNKPVKTIIQIPKPPEPVTLYFVELSEIDEIEAERLLNVAVPGRSIGRLPMTGFKLMVDNCRMTISRWPESWYAFRAKQMLADMPQRFWPRYKVTKEEVDTSMYTQPRPGTKPFTFEEPR